MAARILAEEGPGLLEEILIKHGRASQFDHEIRRRAGIRAGSGPFAAAHPACGRWHRRAISQGLIAALPANAQYRDDHQCHRRGPDHLSPPFARPAGHLSTDHLPRRVCLRPQRQGHPPHTGRRHHPGHRRAGAHLPQHHQPAGRARRRAGHGLAGRGAHHQRRVRPVPPHRAGRAGRGRVS